MRVVEPHQFEKLPKKRRKPLPIATVIALVIAISIGFIFWKQLHSVKKNQKQPESPIQQQSTPATTKTQSNTFKQFTGSEFQELYNKVQPTYPNTQEFSDPPPITGNVEADKRIRDMAASRGYRLSRIPQQAIIKINEPRLENDNLLQPLAAEAWNNLKAAAKKEGIPLTLISAYRSPEYQRNLFMQRLTAHGVTAEQVAAARADTAVQTTLQITAVPGFSRHHTGYTVDMWCEDGSPAFLSSTCFRWISANNYLHAKEYGWIPSYPEGAKEQGPEPEPWEYVWVGRDKLVQ